MFGRTTVASFLAGALLLSACSGGGGSGASATVPGPAPSSVPGGFPALPAIPEVTSSRGVAELTLQAAFDSNGRPAFFWNGQKAAPTIRVKPGDTIKLHFINMLPQFCSPGIESNSNMHFHGLTSSPNAPGDDVITTLAAPGTSLEYRVVINTDQPPGLYWYHAHPHGLSSWEVGNGMAGAIVIEGIANEVPSVAGLRERVIVLSDIPTDPSFAAGEDSERRKVESIRAHAVHPSDDDGGGNPCRAETTAVPMINGIPMASIGIKPGERELFRVVNVAGHRHFDIAVDGQQLVLVAQDGVPIRDYAGAPESLSVSHLVIPPGGRSEFVVTGTAAPQALVSNCYNSGPAGDADPAIVLGTLVDDSTNPNAVRPAVRVRGRLAVMREPLLYRQPLPPPVAKHTIHFQEDANGFYLDGKQYSATAPPAIVSKAGTVEEWTLENDTDEVHDFHIHQVHFIVVSVNGAPVPNPHWLDSYDIIPQGHGVSGQHIPSLTKVLLDFRDPVIRGTFVYHCHILDHEDGGMMAKILVQ
jgi:FtsP/CotA-like multicopper oxidase with cupredoxin domain